VILAGVLVGGVWALTEARDRPQPVRVEAPTPEVTTTVPDALVRALEAINDSLKCADPATQAAVQHRMEEVLSTLPPPPTVPGDQVVVNIHRPVTPAPC
jgi:hypothetical protein